MKRNILLEKWGDFWNTPRPLDIDEINEAGTKRAQEIIMCMDEGQLRIFANEIVSKCLAPQGYKNEMYKALTYKFNGWDE